jgi:hypothetical protein
MEPQEYRDQYLQDLNNTPIPVDPLAALTGNQNRFFTIMKAGAFIVDPAIQPAPSANALLDHARELAQTLGATLEYRMAALYTIGKALDLHPELLNMLLERLADRGEEPTFRLGVLTLLQQARFTTVVLRKRRADFLAALRGLVDDPDPKLRAQVLENLAQEKDEFVQRRLLQGLEQPDTALLASEKAIQLLGYDIHAEYFPLLRELIQHSPNVLAKQEAVKLLATDPSAVLLLQALTLDKNEDPQVRRQAIIALQSLSPEAFEINARTIALDQTDDETVRATCISGLGYFGNGAALQLDTDFNEQLDRVQNSSGSLVVEQAVRSYKTQQNLQ